jgi:hypothetical protein
MGPQIDPCHSSDSENDNVSDEHIEKVASGPSMDPMAPATQPTGMPRMSMRRRRYNPEYGGKPRDNEPQPTHDVARKLYRLPFVLNCRSVQTLLQFSPADRIAKARSAGLASLPVWEIAPQSSPIATWTVEMAKLDRAVHLLYGGNNVGFNVHGVGGYRVAQSELGSSQRSIMPREGWHGILHSIVQLTSLYSIRGGAASFPIIFSRDVQDSGYGTYHDVRLIKGTSYVISTATPGIGGRVVWGNNCYETFVNDVVNWRKLFSCGLGLTEDCRVTIPPVGFAVLAKGGVCGQRSITSKWMTGWPRGDGNAIVGILYRCGAPCDRTGDTDQSAHQILAQLNRCRQLDDMIGHLHSLNVAHGDIKTTNLLVRGTTQDILKNSLWRRVPFTPEEIGVVRLIDWDLMCPCNMEIVFRSAAGDTRVKAVWNAACKGGVTTVQMNMLQDHFGPPQALRSRVIPDVRGSFSRNVAAMPMDVKELSRAPESTVQHADIRMKCFQFDCIKAVLAGHRLSAERLDQGASGFEYSASDSTWPQLKRYMPYCCGVVRGYLDDMFNGRVDPILIDKTRERPLTTWQMVALGAAASASAAEGTGRRICPDWHVTCSPASPQQHDIDEMLFLV